MFCTIILDAYSEELMKAIPPHLAVKKNDLTILNITLGRGCSIHKTCLEKYKTYACQLQVSLVW